MKPSYLLGQLNPIRHVALDMDGTIYRGNTLFPQTPPFLALLKELNIGHTFLTNNSSKHTRDHLAHLHELGIAATAEQLSTSTQATLEYLREARPDFRRLFILGTPGMREEFATAGFVSLPDDPAHEPDAVIVGFDSTLEYARLCRAAWWIKRGKPCFATHPDRVCPTDQPTLLLDCGAICAALESATGVAPAAVPGKPAPAMIRGILRRHSLAPSELAMVGDRLYTDVTMAHHAGVLAVLVLTGEATAEEAENFNPGPDLVVSGLDELAALLQAAKEHELRDPR